MGYQITDDDISFCDAYTTKLCKRCGRLPDEDAIQSGRLGMCEAAITYDPAKSDSFKGWSTYFIKNQIFREYFKMNSSDALDQHEKKIAELDHKCYSMGDAEKTTITKDLFNKAIRRATKRQRSILREMFFFDKNAYDLSREFGGTHQKYDRMFRVAKKRIQTFKMKREMEER